MGTQLLESASAIPASARRQQLKHVAGADLHAALAAEIDCRAVCAR